MQQIKWLDVVFALVGVVLAFGVPTIRTFLREVVMHPLTPSSISQGNSAAPVRTATLHTAKAKQR